MRQLREVLPCLFHNEAQLENGTVEVRDLIERAVFQVAILPVLYVAPADRARPTSRTLNPQTPRSPEGAPIPSPWSPYPSGSYLENWNLGYWMLFLMRMVKFGAILPRNWLRRQTGCV